MTPKEFLRQSHRLNDLINSNLEELSSLREMATNISAQTFERDKLSGAGYVTSRIEEIIVKVCDYELLVNNEIDKFIDLKQDIRAAIVDVIDPDQQCLLRLRYLECLSWEDVQKKMKLSETQIHRLHSEALLKVRVPVKYR